MIDPRWRLFNGYSEWNESHTGEKKDVINDINNYFLNRKNKLIDDRIQQVVLPLQFIYKLIKIYEPGYLINSKIDANNKINLTVNKLKSHGEDISSALIKIDQIKEQNVYIDESLLNFKNEDKADVDNIKKAYELIDNSNKAKIFVKNNSDLANIIKLLSNLVMDNTNNIDQLDNVDAFYFYKCLIVFNHAYMYSSIRYNDSADYKRVLKNIITSISRLQEYYFSINNIMEGYDNPNKYQYISKKDLDSITIKKPDVYLDYGEYLAKLINKVNLFIEEIKGKINNFIKTIEDDSKAINSKEEITIKCKCVAQSLNNTLDEINIDKIEENDNFLDGVVKGSESFKKEQPYNTILTKYNNSLGELETIHEDVKKKINNFKKDVVSIIKTVKDDLGKRYKNLASNDKYRVLNAYKKEVEQKALGSTDFKIIVLQLERLISHQQGLFSFRSRSKLPKSYLLVKDKFKVLHKKLNITEREVDEIIRSKNPQMGILTFKNMYKQNKEFNYE